MKKIIVIALIIMAVLLTACLEFEQGECGGFKGAAKDQCFLEMQKCSKIKNDDLRDICVVGLAESKKDLSVCDLVKNQKIAASCHAKIAIATDNRDSCFNVQDTYWSNNCHNQLAVKHDESFWCSEITTDEQRRRCYYDIALATNDYELCEFQQDEEKGRCLMKIMRETGSVEPCEIFDKSFDRNVCYVSAAKVSEDPSICEKVDAAGLYGKCKDNFEK